MPCDRVGGLWLIEASIIGLVQVDSDAMTEDSKNLNQTQVEFSRSRFGVLECLCKLLTSF